MFHVFVKKNHLIRIFDNKFLIFNMKPIMAVSKSRDKETAMNVTDMSHYLFNISSSSVRFGTV